MSFIQNLGRDLVDKKLWPVAGALAVAAVAVPVAIGGGSSDESVAPLPAAPPQAQAQTDGAVTLATPDTTRAHERPGRSRDPFNAVLTLKVPKTKTAAAGSASATPAAGAGVGAGKSTATGADPSAPTVLGGNGKSSPAPGTTPAAPVPSTSTTKTTTLYEYAVTLQTRRDGKVETRKAVRPISYVPSASYPLLTLLGTRKSGSAAIFLVRDGVQIEGKDRVCRPSRTTCQFLELGSGDSVLISKDPPRGVERHHFRLMVGKIALSPVGEETKAEATARARSRAFRNVNTPKLAPVASVTTTKRTRG